MTTRAVPPSPSLTQRLQTDPWLWLGTGAGICGLALAWLQLFDQAAAGARAGFLFLGLLAAGVAIVIRPKSPLVVGAAAGVGFLGWLALGPWPNSGVPWDSARHMMLFLTGVAAAAAVLLWLPRGVRRGVVSGVIVFHFVGILSTVFSVPPSPWLATNAWTYVFRPYLEFMYLNNAYHFYSPDPGPPNLLWFRLEYEDGSKRWYKLPYREDYPTSINYQRRLSLTESTHAAKLTDPAELALRQQLRLSVQHIIPLHPGLPEAVQFREPTAHAKRMIQNYTRWVAQHDPQAETPRKVVKVRLYRVLHEILEGRDIADGYDPLDMWRYRPYYQGEYDRDGNLLDPHSPMLYWLVPIIRKDDRTGWSPENLNSLVTVKDPDNDRTYEVYDFLKVHTDH